MNNAIYGGVFDVPTNGHLQMIEKAARIFTHIDVLVAPNAAKSTSWFSVGERIGMLKAAIKNLDPKYSIEVLKLPSHIYLASFAKERGASFLVRGIRDIWDFSYEQNIYLTNRRIEPEIETIYLMPDQIYSMVSSSWVKSLVGCEKWTEILRGQVPDCVLEKLVVRHLKARFLKLMERMPGTYSANINTMCDHIFSSYKPFNDNSYHNLGHILKCLEILDHYSHFINPVHRDTIELALWFHDIDPSEEKSAEILKTYMNCCESVQLILATKHNTCEYENLLEQIIVSIDLWALGGSYEEYTVYNKKVFAEYHAISGLSLKEFMPKWNVGRMQFLEKMRKRRCIYPWNVIADIREEQALSNMQMEYSLLEFNKNNS